MDNGKNKREKLCKSTKRVWQRVFYKAELEYLMKVLRKMHLQVLLVNPGDEELMGIDFGIREFLGMEEGYRRALRDSKLWAGGNTIYRLQDELLCSYIFLVLPGAPESRALLIGPYVTFELSRESMLEVAERYRISARLFPQLVEFYKSVPVMGNEMPLFSMITAFGEVLWGSAEAFEVVDLNREYPGAAELFSKGDEEHGAENTMLRMKLMETRYEFENELMEMVSQGQTNRAEVMLAGFSGKNFEQRLSDSLRNLKNYTIICNTLLRKAAERGGVHPIHLDSVSSDFAQKIEAIPNVEKGQELMADMVRSYCRLVRKHSMKHYSPPVQKAVACIESGLVNDLSLRALASTLNINASYLSALFKKETGQTVTEYVNERRMKAAAHMLHTTKLQVQTVAQHCGISDVNYFSKIFKKYYGITPKQFREDSRSHRKNR